MLLALALAAQTVPVPMVEHNHFYVTVDRPTFQAIRQSKWLRDEFANVTVSTHASGDDQWTPSFRPKRNGVKRSGEISQQPPPSSG